LFYKLEPYIPGINKYGILDGGAFSRSEFTDQASQIAYIGLSQRPLFGRGPDNSRILFEEEMQILTNSHNNLLEIGLNYGLIGIFLWYFFFGAMGYKLLKGKKSKYFGVCVGFMASIFVISIISPIYRDPDIYVMYALMLCLLAVPNNRYGLESKLTTK
jgi:O-antigen ligase